MKAASVNYVIAAWSGRRRGKPRPTRNYEDYFNDRTLYLRFHIDQVLKIKEHISHLTIVAPFNFEDEPVEFSQYLEGLPSSVEGVEVTVLRRENMGISFGSFSHAFAELGDKWEYYIFNEDDHIPVAPRFDSHLRKALRKKGSKYGSVCAWRRTDANKSYAAKPIIGHPLSIAKSSTLTKVASANNGKLPYLKDIYSGMSADEFSKGFYKAGYRIGDMLPRFCGAFASGDGRIQWFGAGEGKPLVAPIELWEPKNKKMRDDFGIG